MTVLPLSWQEKITSPFQTDCCYQAVVPFTSEPWLANIGAPSWAFKKTGSQCTGLASPNNWLQRSRWQPPTAGLLSVQQQEMSRRAHQLGVNRTWNPKTSPKLPNFKCQRTGQGAWHSKLLQQQPCSWSAVQYLVCTAAWGEASVMINNTHMSTADIEVEPKLVESLNCRSI